MKTVWWYPWLRSLVKLGLHLFFKRYQWQGLENIPSDRPALLVCNHQNAFLDALLVLCAMKKSPWFFARGDVFLNPRFSQFLHALKILPIYRFRDGGYSVLKQNQQSFEDARKLFEAGESLLIFGEGNHGEKWQIRPLQKGFARLAFHTMEQSEWNSPLCVIPVGIQYENREQVYSEVLVSFGKPIELKPLQAGYEQSPPQALHALLETLQARMQALVVHIPEENYEQQRAALHTHRKKLKNLSERLKQDQALLASLGKEKPTSKSLKEQKKLFPQLVLGYALFNHWPYRFLTQKLVAKTGDQQFKLSLSFLTFLLLYPILLLSQSAVILLISQSWIVTIAYGITLPLSAGLSLSRN